MSCCSGCDSGWDCESGLSGLYGLSGLMGDLLAPGSQIRVGFAYNFDSTAAGVQAQNNGPGWIQTTLANQLRELGVFSSVNVFVQPPQYQNFQDGYITVQVTTADGQSDPNNIGDMAQYAISAYLPGVSIERRDGAVIDYIPPSEVGKPGVAQVTQLPATVPPPPPPPGTCVWETMSFGDYVACQLGIKSAIGGVTAGATGALLGVGVITLLAVVLLKR